MRKSRCFYCGRGFTPTRSDQLFCSKQCRMRSYRSESPIFPVKAEVFDRIADGTQTEVYREITPYWTNRFENLFRKIADFSYVPLKMVWDNESKFVEFRNGTGNHMRRIEAQCTIREGTGKEEWGAAPGKEYYILTVQQIIKHHRE